MTHEQITKEYVARKKKYFEAREAYNKAKRREAYRLPKVPLALVTELVELSHDFGWHKSRFTEFEKQYGHLIIRNQ